MNITLILLNLVFLLCTIAFNAELLSLAGSDITLKHFDRIAEIGQILSSFGVTLLAWRIIAQYKSGKALFKAWGIAILVLYPVTYFAQSAISTLIIEKMPHEYKVASLYAYVLKKGYLSEVIQFPDFPNVRGKDSGAHTAFIANMGVLFNPDNLYIKGIDENFSGFSSKVFKGYWKSHQDELYQRYTKRGVSRFKEVIRTYAIIEQKRAENPHSSKFKSVPLKGIVADGTEKEQNFRYALAFPPGIRDANTLLQHRAMHLLAADSLGPLYVQGMSLNASQQLFNTYIPYISNNMASAITATDLSGEQGQMILKNMIFLPLTLFTSLFFGIISFVVLVFSLMELRQPATPRPKLKLALILVLLLMPFIIGNPIVKSQGYTILIKRSGDGVEFIQPILKWAMITEGWLYTLKTKVAGD